MRVDIKVPSMGESISEAMIGAILKPAGSVVRQDDEILELETDKVNQVLYAPQAGTLHLTVKMDDKVAIGQVIGYIDADGSAPQVEEKPKAEPVVKPVAASPPPPQPKAPPAPAREGSRYTKEQAIDDIKRVDAPKTVQSTDGREERVRMTRVRRVIAERLVASQQTTAMLTTFNEADLTRVVALRERYRDTFLKDHGVKLGFMSFFVKAVVFALHEVPGLNSYIDGDELVRRLYYDVGVAVGTDRGLFVPVLRDCDKLTFAEIEQKIVAFSKKAKEGTLQADDLTGGGFTITNGGVYGSLLSTPIINPPQSGILGMHKIQQRPVAVDGEIVIRPMMYLAMSYDHRVVDGKEAVTFLVHVKECLEDPARLMLEV